MRNRMNTYLFMMAAPALLLTACATQADPEAYMSYDCKQLRMLSESRAPTDPFAANRVGPDPQAGLSGDRQGLRTQDADLVEKRDDETRSIRAAYLKKGC
ncbi:hypothetical protein DES40_2165 [Litorimonas taeanensis]|uniref:Lipoprotein n=1 Tax=Litorimonas taeanensis TaxID=568099 RepID=A0A420WEM3_9PROT|nr:hypothetical protein [Litorimonas taeanensis]RKQ69365.1 hypothetical protein DES40_2165 [Litorimonas taeanensis]